MPDNVFTNDTYRIDWHGGIDSLKIHALFTIA